MLELIIKHLETLLPISLVVLAFILKLLVDQKANVPLVIKSLYELPVEVLFLSLTFTGAFILTSSENDKGLILFISVIIIIILSIVGWKRSIYCFENGKIWLSVFIFLINLVTSSIFLVLSVSLLIGDKNA